MEDLSQQSLYRILNQEVKVWWYFKKLRKQGATEEARKRERESIRRTVQEVRDALYFRVAQGGYRLILRPKFTPNGKAISFGEVSHCSLGLHLQEALKRCRPEVPRINSLNASLRTLNLPLVARYEGEVESPFYEDGAYHSMQFAPMGVVLAGYEAFGAEVHWGNLNPEEWRQKAAPTIRRIRRTKENK